MILQGNSQSKVVISKVERLFLPFTPVCDIATDIAFPYFPGSRVTQVDFSIHSSNASEGASGSTVSGKKIG